MLMRQRLIKYISTTIRYYRKSKVLSQEELAHFSGLDRTYISGVERGVRNITIDSLEQIIEALEVPQEIFFEKIIKEMKDDIHN